MLLIAAAATIFAWDYLHFDLPSGSKEALWRDGLAKKIGGTTGHQSEAAVRGAALA